MASVFSSSAAQPLSLVSFPSGKNLMLTIQDFSETVGSEFAKCDLGLGEKFNITVQAFVRGYSRSPCYGCTLSKVGENSYEAEITSSSHSVSDETETVMADNLVDLIDFLGTYAF